MLAVVHDLIGAGVLVRGSPATDVRTAFEQSDFVSSVSEGASSREAGEAGADDGDCSLVRTQLGHQPSISLLSRLKMLMRYPITSVMNAYSIPLRMAVIAKN